PVATLPVRQVRRRLVGQALPPHVTVIGAGNVGEDAVAPERVDGVLVRTEAGAGRDAEEPGFRVDGIQAAVVTETHPADVVANRLGLPTRDGGLQHREVGLATSARER